MLQFCPVCRNANIDKRIVDACETTATAVCPDCGEHFEFSYLPLHILEGAPATGKSTTAGRIQDRIDLAIYEGDAHMSVTAGNLSWDEICDLDLRFCLTLHAAGQQALFVGGVYPHSLEESPETRYFSRIERCALVCDDDDLLDRSRARAGDVPDEMDYLHDVNRWYREHGPEQGIEVLNTSALNPDAVAQRVADWIDG
jgi:hypothetical protein